METMKGLLVIALAILILFPHEPPAVWVEVHDVSPVYGADELSKVVEVLEKHNVDRVVIFVIPNHGGSAPLSEHPEFTDYLKELEGRGYEIGAHGYMHSRHEFNCSGDEAMHLLNLSIGEFHAVDIRPQVFLPPRFILSDESSAVLDDSFGEIYLKRKVVKGGEEFPYVYNELAWYRLPKWIIMAIAEASYGASRSDVYRLSLHMGMIDGKRLECLEKFLEFTDSKRINTDGRQGDTDGNR